MPSQAGTGREASEHFHVARLGVPGSSAG